MDKSGTPLYDDDYLGFSMSVCQCSPVSTGAVRIRSADLAQAAAIGPTT